MAKAPSADAIGASTQEKKNKNKTKVNGEKNIQRV